MIYSGCSSTDEMECEDASEESTSHSSVCMGFGGKRVVLTAFCHVAALTVGSAACCEPNRPVSGSAGDD